jgi:hypothetical protein
LPLPYLSTIARHLSDGNDKSKPQLLLETSSLQHALKVKSMVKQEVGAGDGWLSDDSSFYGMYSHAEV